MVENVWFHTCDICIVSSFPMCITFKMLNSSLGGNLRVHKCIIFSIASSVLFSRIQLQTSSICFALTLWLTLSSYLKSLSLETVSQWK